MDSSQDIKQILLKREAMRQAINPNPRTMESKLLEITKNANLKTRDKYPEPSEAERRFRNYVDKHVDCLNRLSTTSLLGRLKSRHIYAGDINMQTAKVAMMQQEDRQS